VISLDCQACSGCGTCALVCPHRVIELVDKRAQLAHEQRCIECGACQLNCHDQAITVTKGTGCLVVIIKQDILKLDKKQAGCDCGC
jgi:NAD-dependent dihydropyrimidine dehydrogenase PreA subunit